MRPLYRLRAITFSTQELPDVTTQVDTQYTASVQDLKRPYVIIGASFISTKSTAFDIDDFLYTQMGIPSQYEAYKKLSLLSTVDDNDNRFANLLWLAGDLIDFEINCPKIILSTLLPADLPVIHILEKQ